MISWACRQSLFPLSLWIFQVASYKLILYDHHGKILYSHPSIMFQYRMLYLKTLNTLMEVNFATRENISPSQLPRLGIIPLLLVEPCTSWPNLFCSTFYWTPTYFQWVSFHLVMQPNTMFHSFVRYPFILPCSVSRVYPLSNFLLMFTTWDPLLWNLMLIPWSFSPH